ncbi:response regulator [Aerosakkonemataceae cyanobacterium BLCC-F154]|uniref:Response regulator n=1 Tax=Floridaenema fluviatile BLCC-F154 TaxID=3153640 RepID=A0ABV4YA21_9CYAN
MATILIIDDAALSRQLLRRILQPEGYTIWEAKNGLEGLELLVKQQQRPDCILVDILMPEMGGVEFLKAIRQQEIKIPTIVITADIQETTRVECLELGAMTVIHKLVKPDELRHWIKKALKNLPQEESYETNT